MNQKIEIHKGNNNIERQLNYVTGWNINKELEKDLILFLKDLGSGNVDFINKHPIRSSTIKDKIYFVYL